MDSQPSRSHDQALSTEARLAVGAQVGPFRIEGLIGAGGMGEVYLAVDTRLNRKVAIKVSAEQFSGRFEREARAIAALNHPNICTLHDIGPNYLVMEFVEGETLAARLKRGALPRELVLRFGTAIAQALAAAHGKGIVHRDLKPGNIMIAKSGIKVLDFGLAKSGHDETVTASNAIIGTPAYMAPEQSEGRASDARTDIYALGLVLYEMAAGKRVSQGEPLSADVLPLPLAQAIRSCLMKDPEQRWQSAADIAIALNWTLDEHPAKRPGQRWGAWWAAAITVLALILVLIGTRFRQPPADAKFVQLQLNAPPGAEFGSAIQTAISPDGQTLAFVAGSARRLWVRAFDSLVARELPGTDGAILPFWSPNGRSLGFFADAKLKRIDLAGERVVILADAPAGRGGTWNADDIILFGAATNGPIWKVSALGGTPAPATTLDSSREASHRFPQFLPDGRRFCFPSAAERLPCEVFIWHRSKHRIKKTASWKASSTAGMRLRKDHFPGTCCG
jgi:eukaryotic-like serine/threonine-protein kinase